MAYHSTDVYGITHINPDEAILRDVLEGVFDAEDVPHPDASIMHESGWILTYSRSRCLTLEHADNENMRLLRNVLPNQALQYWYWLARGQITALLNLEWMEHI